MRVDKRDTIGRWLRGAVGALAALAALGAAGCDGLSDDILQVTDPDIIEPQLVNNAEGAEAMRIGTLARFVGATTGHNAGSSGETLFQHGGMLADEWQTGDTFVQRLELDQRIVKSNNSLVRNGFMYAQRARVSAAQTVAALREFSPTAPAWQVAEMYFVQAYIENMLAEHFCSGVPFSLILGGQEQYGSPQTTQQALARALAHADSGLTLLPASLTDANSVRVRNAAAVTRGRILVNLNRLEEAAAAVQAVPTTFAYVHQHSQTSRDNAAWAINNNQRRYTVADREGANGLNFASAADPRLPVCRGGSTACRAAGVTQTRVFSNAAEPALNVQLLWPTRDSPHSVANGIEARLIQAEAQLRAGNSAAALATLNQLRTGVAGLAPLTLQATAADQADQLFRERAFWLYGTGHRLGDLRRLVRQYGRAQNTVFPTGRFLGGGDYGTDVNLPIPQEEQNNPNATQGCLNRDA